MRKRRPKRNIHTGKLIFVSLLILVLISYVVMDLQVRPKIRSAAQKSATLLATREINDTVAALLSQKHMDYGSFITPMYGEDNALTALESNIVVLNQFKAEVNTGIARTLESINDGTFSIHLGTLFGNSFLSGRGPRIGFKYDIVCAVTSQLRDVFIDAGINQVKHQIILRVDCDMSIMVPWYDTAAQVTTDVLVAETIIVGKVPNTYLGLDLQNGLKTASETTTAGK